MRLDNSGGRFLLPTSGSKVFRGGPVITMANDGAILPAGTGIVCVDGVIHGFIPPDAPIPDSAQAQDLGHTAITPAFIDPHAHLGMTNESLTRTVDCHTPPCSTIEDIIAVLSDGIHLAEARDGWLLGQGSLMHDQKLADGRLPNRDDLDRVSRKVPIVLRCGGHVTILNSKALELSGLAVAGKFEGTAELMQFPDGRPNGVLVEGYGLLPVPSVDRNERRAQLRRTLATLYVRRGTIRVNEISHSVESLEDLAHVLNDLPLTVEAFVWMPEHAKSVQEVVELRQRFASSPLHIRGIKIFVDGGFSARTAAVTRPYATDGGQGELYYGLEQLTTLIREASEHGLQLAAHVNGGRAQELVCAANVQALGSAAADAGTRLEHAGNFVQDIAIVDRWLDAGVHIVTQPGFIYTMGAAFPQLFGDEGRRGRFPYQTLANRGLNVAASSDVSGSELRHTDPMFNAWCAVERIGFDGEAIEPHESLDVIAALRMHTIQAARASTVANKLGSLEVGKEASFIALDQDLRQLEGSALLDAQVAAVVVEGRTVACKLS
jgi:predicted amidohydrolase YtcJ